VHASHAPVAIPARDPKTTLKNPTGASGGNNAGPAKKNDKDDKRKKRGSGSRPSRKKPKKIEVRKEASGPEEQASDSEDSDEKEEEEEASNVGPISRQGNVVSELKPAWFAPTVTFNATAAKMKEWLGQLKLPKNGSKAELQARLHKHLLAAEQTVE